MTLSEVARERLADVVELQPTRNAELQDRWDLESGSEVHRYLEAELEEYYFRDDNSLIRATPEAADLVDVQPGVEADEDGTTTRVRVSALEAAILDTIAGPDEKPQSVVAVFHAVRDTVETPPDVDAVRSALKRLRRKGTVTVEQKTVPTYRLAVERDALTVVTTE